MASRTVIDGNAFYEIDEECLERKKKKETEEQAGSGEGQRRGNTSDMGSRPLGTKDI